jgi:pimeloyl-ACP methyl ester carboxylesterase
MKETVVLLHGVWMRSPCMWLIAKDLRKRGFRTVQFGYGSLLRAPGASMERLAMKLYSMGNGPIHLVGHSLGGLMALETLNQYQKMPRGRVVCLGSPIAGSATARALAEKNMKFMTGKSGALLRGGLIQLPQNREIGMIAGTKEKGVGKLVTPFYGMHDGTVAVYETRLPGLHEHMMVPLTHSGLLMSKKVNEHIANFLQTGFF